jgi:hypothetical protein
MRRYFVILSLVAACLLVTPLGPAGASEGRSWNAHVSAAVFAPQSRPYGLSYSQWAARWSQWAFGTPTPQNALADPANCDVAQRGPAFMLPAASSPGVVASCSVPSGEALLLPPAGNLYTPGDGLNTYSQLLAAAKAATDGLTKVSASLDGAPLPTQPFRTASPFVLFLPSDNILGVSAGPTRAAIDGYFLMLKPLCAGTHIIRAADTFPDGTSADITITVHVIAHGSR